MMLKRLTATVSSRLHLPGTVIGALALVLLFVPTVARAHGISAFAHSEGDAIVVEGYFHDGAKCKDCSVEAYDSQGQKIAGGKTNAEGIFSFKAPARTDILIRLTDSFGHMAEYRVPASDLPDSLPAGHEAFHNNSHASDAVNSSTVSRLPEADDAGDIEQMVEGAVARQLEPIRRTMAESQRRRRISDVIGGIGYIVGLMGLILYFRSKRKQ
jgi:nickel transport protein